MIHLRGLTKRFGRRSVLRDIDLEVREGEFLVIFGPNGAGKTTLLRILASLIQASSGEISIGGFSMREQPEALRRRIGVIGHHTFLYHDLTAAENLRFYGRMYDVSDLGSKVQRALREVGLEQRARDAVGTFSRGMQQRLAVARALLHDPPILLLDEPFTGLDPQGSEMLSHTLRSLWHRGRTVVMTTHDVERGLELAQRVAVLVEGRLVYQQPKEAIDVQTFRQTYDGLVSARAE